MVQLVVRQNRINLVFMNVFSSLGVFGSSFFFNLIEQASIDASIKGVTKVEGPVKDSIAYNLASDVDPLNSTASLYANIMNVLMTSDDFTFTFQFKITTKPDKKSLKYTLVSMAQNVASDASDQNIKTYFAISLRFQGELLPEGIPAE